MRSVREPDPSHQPPGGAAARFDDAGIVLTARGVTALAPPFGVHTGWTVEVADPWGNVIGLTDYTLQPQRARPQ